MVFLQLPGRFTLGGRASTLIFKRTRLNSNAQTLTTDLVPCQAKAFIGSIEDLECVQFPYQGSGVKMNTSLLHLKVSAQLLLELGALWLNA
jgi:hypothetical protein